MGHYKVEKSEKVDHNEGYTIIHQTLSIDYQINDYHFCEIELSMNSYGNAEEIGFSHINYLIYVDDEIERIYDREFGEPSIYCSNDYTLYLTKNNEFIIRGNLTFLFIMDSTIYNETVSFQIGLNIPYGPTDISQIDLGLVWVNIFYVISYILIPVILYFIIKPDLSISYNPESRKQDARFWKHLQDELKKQREEEKE